MGLKRTIEPTELILTLGEAKDHLRVTMDNEDSLIEGLILTAQNFIELFIRRSLVPQTWEYTLNEFPAGKVQLPNSPLISITNIKYIDPDGVEQTWANTEYDEFNNTIPGYFKLAYNKTYPSIRSVQDAVKITYQAGYASREKIPAVIRQAAFLTIGHYYERREESIVGAKINSIPMGVETLLWPHRMFTP